MSWFEKENPNKVTRKHFELAINLADKCKPERPDKIAPKVGAVIVKDGKVITKSHRNQTGSGDHAEFIAFEQRGIDKVDFVGADLITTLEPCTEKRHGKEKKACAEWVKLRRIRKVWIGVLDQNPSIRGKAVTMFQEQGIAVGFFPDDLVPKILEQNKEFFEAIKMMTQSISPEELESRRTEVKELVEKEIEIYKEINQLLQSMLQLQSSGSVVLGERAADIRPKSSSEKLASIFLGKSILQWLQETLNRLMISNAQSEEDWFKIGWNLLVSHEVGIILWKGVNELEILTERTKTLIDQTKSEHGQSVLEKGQPFEIGEPSIIAPAARSFDTAVKINGLCTEGRFGKAWVELLIGDYERAFDTIEYVKSSIESGVEIAEFYALLSRKMRNLGFSSWHTAYRRSKDLRP